MTQLTQPIVQLTTRQAQDASFEIGVSDKLVPETRVYTCDRLVVAFAYPTDLWCHTCLAHQRSSISDKIRRKEILKKTRNAAVINRTRLEASTAATAIAASTST